MSYEQFQRFLLTSIIQRLPSDQISPEHFLSSFSSFFNFGILYILYPISASQILIHFLELFSCWVLPIIISNCTTFFLYKLKKTKLCTTDMAFMFCILKHTLYIC